MSELVSVQIVTYNSAKYIEACIRSIIRQTYPNIEITVIDNASVDNSTAIVKGIDHPIKLIENKSNTGFCGGHNIGFRAAKGDYVFIVNPDIIMTDNLIEKLVQEMQQDAKIGLLSPKLLRMSEENSTAQIIDSTGIVLSKDRRAYDRGQGEQDNGQYDKDQNIFGVCGAAAFYRKTMLQDVQVDGEYFDEAFFAYKEDVDLSWRAKLYGWQCRFVPQAVAYHYRGWQSGSRHKQPAWIKVHSKKNRYLMLLKNEKAKDFIKYLPWIIATDCAILIYSLIKEPNTLTYISDFMKHLHTTIEKRKIIQAKAKSKTS